MQGVYKAKTFVIEGIQFKQSINSKRDIDFMATLRSLLEHKADPSLQSRSGKYPLFKAIKVSADTFESVLDACLDAEEAVNVQNRRGLTLPCKAVQLPKSDENTRILSLLVSRRASCEASLPHFDPLSAAIKAGNSRAVEVLMHSEDSLTAFARK